jgi:hypothetical protein
MWHRIVYRITEHYILEDNIIRNSLCFPLDWDIKFIKGKVAPRHEDVWGSWGVGPPFLT